MEHQELQQVFELNKFFHNQKDQQVQHLICQELEDSTICIIKTYNYGMCQKLTKAISDKKSEELL